MDFEAIQIILEQFLQHLRALFGVEKAALGWVGHYGDHHMVEDREATFDDVHVAVGRRIETARTQGRAHDSSFVYVQSLLSP